MLAPVLLLAHSLTRSLAHSLAHLLTSAGSCGRSNAPCTSAWAVRKHVKNVVDSTDTEREQEMNVLGSEVFKDERDANNELFKKVRFTREVRLLFEKHGLVGRWAPTAITCCESPKPRCADRPSSQSLSRSTLRRPSPKNSEKSTPRFV
jgi:hypothetical protein